MRNAFSASIEFLPGQSAAIVSLFDSTGEWSGASRLDFKRGDRAAHYELGYKHASQMAAVKGGSLERFTVEAASAA